MHMEFPCGEDRRPLKTQPAAPCRKVLLITMLHITELQPPGISRKPDDNKLEIFRRHRTLRALKRAIPSSREDYGGIRTQLAWDWT